MSKTRIEKHSVTIAGHRTSLSLEAVFWEMLRDAAREEGKSLNRLVAEIDAGRDGNLSSAVRVFLVGRLRRRAALLSVIPDSEPPDPAEEGRPEDKPGERDRESP